jgi:hypothetical protein
VDTDTAGTYACSLAGTDAADFTASISGKVCTVVFAANPNFESPADGNTDNVYDITVAFTDGTNALGAQTTAITVTNTAIAITASQTGTAAEDASIGTTVMTVATTGDVDTDSFSITAGNTGTAFAINAATGVITTAAALDYETTASYSLTISVSDGTAADTETVAISITDGSVTITGSQTASVAESASSGSTVMTVATTGDAPLVFAINGGNTGNAFAISNTGVITTAATLDYETTTSYSLVIGTSDTNGADIETVVISVTDVNDQTPAVTVAATYTQAEAAATTFQAFTMVDSDTSGTYACTLGGTDAADFTASVSGKVCTVIRS